MRPRRLLLFAFILMLGAGMVTVSVPAGREALADGVEALRAAGAMGKLAAVGMVFVGVPLGAPAFFLAALLGYLYGIVAGLALSLTTIPLAATVTFLLARWLFREEVAALVARRPRWRALIGGVGQDGTKIVILLRLAGPHNVLNLGLAATPLSLRSFALGTAIGCVPSMTLATVGGALAPNAAALWENRDSLAPASIALIVAGIVGFVFALWLIRRAANRALDRELAAREP